MDMQGHRRSSLSLRGFPVGPEPSMLREQTQRVEPSGSSNGPFTIARVPVARPHGGTELERLLGIEDAPPLVEVALEEQPTPSGGPTVICPLGQGSPVWMNGPECRVLARPNRNGRQGHAFASFVTADGETFACSETDDGRVHLPFSLTEAYQSYVTESWAFDHLGRSLSTKQLDLYYRIKRLIPRRMQLALRRRLIKWQGTPAFPRWPYDDSVERLVRFYGGCVLRALRSEKAAFNWFWPNGAHAAVILTHDVEGVAGLANAVRIADLEEQRGFRSSFNIVGDGYPIDWGVVHELRERGHEIGSHALYHDRSLFSNRAEFERQLPELCNVVGRMGAVGFRSPATHRVAEWLGELPVEYDTTMALSDPYEPQPGGVCTTWPFFLGDVVELPYTLPQDHTLFNLLGYRSASPWIEQMQRVKRSFGLVQCVSHPDPGYLGESRNETVYAEFLDALSAEEGMWHALPRDVARWWRARSQGRSLPWLELSRGTVARRPDSPLAELLPPAAERLDLTGPRSSVGTAAARTPRNASEPPSTGARQPPVPRV
jgi:peptidoglycan/xylan/chitin deacetylase (PgdA/CDA1 family)